MIGKSFKRERDASDQNAALNYGHTRLRAACARSIVAAGFHPSFSIHHESRGEALRLADDMMEPSRAWVDLTAWQIRDAFKDSELTVELKAKLMDDLSINLQTRWGTSLLQLCLDQLVQSLRTVALVSVLNLIFKLRPHCPCLIRSCWHE